MTTIRQNSFEGGAAAGGEGTGITTGNSGGASGDPFTTVTLPTAGTSFTYKFSSTGDDPSGTFGGRWQLSGVTTGGWRAYHQWTADSTQLACRYVFCFNTINATALLLATIVNGSSVTNAQILVNASHQLQVRNHAGTAIGSASSALSAGTVYVLEMQVDSGSTNANGVINAQLYTLANPASQIWSSPNSGVDAGGVSGAASEQPIRMQQGNNDVVANLDLTFDDLYVVTGTTTPVGPPIAAFPYSGMVSRPAVITGFSGRFGAQHSR